MTMRFDIQAEVMRLFHAERWKIGTIAAQLGLHHSAVRRVLQRNGIRLPPPKRPTKIAAYVAMIKETLEKYPTLRATRLLEMLRQRGYTGQISRLREVVSTLRPRGATEAYLRLTTLPGEQGQVDWADFGEIDVGRAKRRLMAFVMVLSWSRGVFVCFFYGARMSAFLAGHAAALEYFGGVCRVVLYDNLKSAVLERIGGAIRFNPILLQLAAHYRFEPRPVAPARGNQKGRVERVIRFVRERFFAGRSFTSLADLNAQALEFCRGVALVRDWPEDKRRTVGAALEEERPLLLPLPHEPFPCAEQVAARAGKTPYVRFDRNDYSVPHTHVRRELVVVADLETVRVVDGTAVIAEHARCYSAGEVIEAAAHVEALVAEKAAARAHHDVGRLQQAVPATRELLRVLAERGEPLARAVRQLGELLDEYGPGPLQQTILDAMERDLFHVPTLRHALERIGTAANIGRAELPARLRDVSVQPHDLRTYDALHAASAAEEDDDAEDA